MPYSYECIYEIWEVLEFLWNQQRKWDDNEDKPQKCTCPFSDVGWFTKCQSMQLKKVENRCPVCFIRIFFIIIGVPHFHEIDGYTIWTDVIRHELIKELLISLKSGLPQTPGMFDNGKQFESHQVLLPLPVTFTWIARLGWTGRKETLYLPLENHLF